MNNSKDSLPELDKENVDNQLRKLHLDIASKSSTDTKNNMSST